MEEHQTTLPILDKEELRILGALMEKSKTTPEYYPMTINGLTAACNQKTSRNPVVQFDEQTVVLALDRLKRKGLVSTATGGSSRSVKYKHNFAIVFQIMPAETAALCLLLLRGSQTPGELNTRSGKLYEFESLEEVQTVLEKLMDRPLPFVKSLPRQPGQKEVRYAHLLGGEPEQAEEMGQEVVYAEGTTEARLAALEQELATLRREFDKLLKELVG